MKLNIRLFVVLFIILILGSNDVTAQSLQTNIPVLEEYLRRSQVLGEYNYHGFLLRPISFLDSSSIIHKNFEFKNLVNGKNGKIKLLPFYSSTGYSHGSPYPEVSNFVMAKGLQIYASGGFFASIGPFSFQFQPELIYAQNQYYQTGFSKSTNTEQLERFGEGVYKKILPGQSSVRLNLGAFSLGASTENIWWGPGQFNSLLFSNNAFGFEYLTFNTRKPAKTIIGRFEGQLLVGRLLGSDLSTSSVEGLLDDWRYMNGISFSYQPKWIPGLYIGASRVFQQYNSYKGNSFEDYFPIFEGLQKERLLEDFEDPSVFDKKGIDQQLTGFVRYVNSKAKTELYFEYGRRDHAYNWREAILNPEHARAYLFGFIKLFEVKDDAFIQLRGEVLQQQESIHIIIRYDGTGGDTNWGGHGTVLHGFSHKGQMLGPGVGPSSNVQTLEGAWVKGFKKIGIRLERLNRHQDIYQKRFPDPSEQGRWVDLSARLLADWQWNNLILSSNINFVNSLNYQWQLAPESTPDFPSGENVFSLHSQVSLIYLFNK